MFTFCDPGEKLLSGGAYWDTNDPDVAIQNSYASIIYIPGPVRAWYVRGANKDGAMHSLTSQAVCLEP